MALNIRRHADEGWVSRLFIETGTKLIDLSPESGTFSINSTPNVSEYNVQNEKATKRLVTGGTVEVTLDTLYYSAVSRDLEDLSKDKSKDVWLIVVLGRGKLIGEGNALDTSRVFLGRVAIGAVEINASAGELVTATATFNMADEWYQGDKLASFSARRQGNFTAASWGYDSDQSSTGGAGREESWILATEVARATTSPVDSKYTISDGTNHSAVATVNRAGLFHMGKDGSNTEPVETGTGIVLRPTVTNANPVTEKFYWIIARQKGFA